MVFQPLFLSWLQDMPFSHYFPNKTHFIALSNHFLDFSSFRLLLPRTSIEFQPVNSGLDIIQEKGKWLNIRVKIDFDWDYDMLIPFNGV